MNGSGNIGCGQENDLLALQFASLEGRAGAAGVCSDDSSRSNLQL